MIDKVTEYVFYSMFFQLPLSGSRALTEDEAITLVQTAFISLSRDHRALSRDFSALRGVLPRRPFAQINFETTI
jgi:hypothetical protein